MTVMKPMTALYIRTARNDVKPEERNSISSQRAMLRKYTAEHGIDNIKEYIDDGYLGNNMNRPGWQAMIADIEKVLIDAVIITDISRLARDSALCSYYTELFFPEHKVRFISVIDGIDSTDGDSALLPFNAIMNEFYGRNCVQRNCILKQATI
jgi:DNA invertase Pin-like site-specific DNA recombinase